MNNIYVLHQFCHENSLRVQHGNIHGNVNVFGLGGTDLLLLPLLRQSKYPDVLLPVHPEICCCKHVRNTAAAHITYMK